MLAPAAYHARGVNHGFYAWRVLLSYSLRARVRRPETAAFTSVKLGGTRSRASYWARSTSLSRIVIYPLPILLHTPEIVNSPPPSSTEILDKPLISYPIAILLPSSIISADEEGLLSPEGIFAKASGRTVLRGLQTY